MPTTTAPDTDDATEEETEDEYVPTSWEFIGTAPTVDAVRALLEKLPEQWGVAPVDFLDFVQALPAKKKIKRQTENDRGRKVTVDEWVDIWSLYMTVAGRIAMLNRCAEVNGWRVDLTPDPGPDGRGGYVELGVGEDGRIVYREACIIYQADGETERLLGTKSGTAWNAAQLPGESAKATSPFEKCVVPGTRVLTDGLRWVPIEELAPGDTLIGFDEDPAGRGVGQRFRRATVEASKWLRRECVRIETSSGTVECSTDHMWVVSNPSTNRSWRAASDLKPGDRIVSVGEPWTFEDSYEGGWLAGFLDGEGHVGNGLLRFTQKAGPVMDQAMSLFDKLGIPYSINTEVRPDGSHILRGHVIDGHLTSLRALGQIRPVRLLARSEDMWLGKRSFGRALKVAEVKSVEPVGIRDVVAMQTSTRTFIAEGMFSHNCETAARGRAIAAWGIGILPGSGVASVEEMQNRAQIEQGQQRQQQRDADPRRPDRSAPRKTREELIDEAYTLAEDVRQRRGEDKPIARSIIEYGRTIGVAQDFPTDADDDSDDGTWEVDWSMWNDGKITQLVGALTQTQRVLIDRDQPI